MDEVVINGVKMTLDQNAYVDGTNEDPHFQALAHDANENKYMVRWDIDPDYDDPDGNGVRDWDQPSDAELIQKGHIAVVDEDAIDELNNIAREGVRVLKPGELREWLADEAENYDEEECGGVNKFNDIAKLSKYVDDCIDMPDDDITNLLPGDGYGVDINNCIPVVVDDANLDGVYSIEALGATPSRELFTDRIEADKLIADVPLYSVTVDGKRVYNDGEGFHWLDGEGLWQAMSEELDLVPDGNDDRLADWQDLPDDDIDTLLHCAKEEGFIKDYDIDEL